MSKNNASSIKFLPPIPSDNKPLTDLTIYNVAQLGEIRDRQMHLLSNKKRLATLPDKGERIRTLHQRIIAELATRDAVQQASELFSAMNLAATGKSLTTQMEWYGKTMNGGPDTAAANDAVDVDERDPLKLLAQSRHTAKVITIEQPAESLITAADRQQIAEFAQTKSADETTTETTGNATVAADELEPHALYMCSINDRHPDKKERFLPHKTVVAHVASTSPLPANRAQSPKPLGKYWENTAATFPLLRNQSVIALSLHDSIEIQRQQFTAMKSAELMNAGERLRAHEQLVTKLNQERDKVDDGSVTRSMFSGAYRDASGHSDSDQNSSDDDDINNPHAAGNSIHSDDEYQEEN